jgi:hypothetical protein
MANSSINLASLDFDTLKQNFKDYLKAQSTFKDYNFDGSNMSVLLDVMAYNSYLNSFYLNMVASEMFLDSAQKIDSVISHAKELNYIPRSSHAAAANVSFTVDTSGFTTNKLTIPKGTRFSGYNSNGTYTFVTDQSLTFTSSNSTFSVENIQISEGDYFNDSFVVDYDIEDQRFILSNQNIDINTITVNVVENSGLSNTQFVFAASLFGLKGGSEVYFVQAVEGGRYEILFGDGLFGRKPLNGASVQVNYIVTDGSDGNGVDNFTLTDNIGPSNGGTATASAITVITPSVYGANQENIENIRFNAPRYYATQQRAVSVDDYASLVYAKFGGAVDDVIVYGGQDLEPKLYGRVVVSIKPTASTIASSLLKNSIVNYLQDYIALPNRVIVTDPEYFYIKINSIVQYNSKLTTKYASEVRSIILNDILEFSSAHLEKFGNDFRYSRFVTHIDDADTSITSNDTHVKIVKRINPKLNYATSYSIAFNNPAELEGVYGGVAYPDERVFNSSSFSYIDEKDNIIPNCYMEDDALGSILVYTYVRGVKTTVNPNIGVIDYESGIVSLSNLKSSYYGNYLLLELKTRNKDIIATKNMVLVIEPEDVTIDVIETIR